MLRFFSQSARHFQNQYIFHQSYKQALLSFNQGDKKVALMQLQALLEKQPGNVYLRHQIVLVSEALNEQIELPEIKVKTSASHV